MGFRGSFFWLLAVLAWHRQDCNASLSRKVRPVQIGEINCNNTTTPITGWWLVVGGKTTVTPLLFHCPSWEKGHTITVICVTVTYNKAYFWVAIEHSCRSPLLQLQLQPATATRNQTKVHTIIDAIHYCTLYTCTCQLYTRYTCMFHQLPEKMTSRRHFGL